MAVWEVVGDVEDCLAGNVETISCWRWRVGDSLSRCVAGFIRQWLFSQHAFHAPAC